MSDMSRPWDRPAAELAGTSESVTVVADPDGRPRWVVGPDGPAGALPVAADRPVSDILRSDTVLPLLADGLPGVVVVDDEGRAVGVIPVEVLRDLLVAANESDPAFSGVLDGTVDVTLVGGARPADAIRVRCGVCQTVNELGEFPEPGQPCAGGGHPLRPEWQ
ncbi:CBS domain-containing protein [Actinoplanes siamensis]|uniref:CBS domain-containing protein n=1 Tax=Actinoplanes siamensis TaxID=1223317 RepID=A0A919N9X2_9ACTN|nr:hypothetical protein [Actinoplanes siamensis]GIF06930.1 hypothetical protein Asi03nite_44680 [Actinoplanes siamensis]